LVCGLAALGVNPSGRGFRGADTYPSILSAVIKVAHFMIVQQAERLTQLTTIVKCDRLDHIYLQPETGLGLYPNKVDPI
jgi:hypothetical protein